VVGTFVGEMEGWETSFDVSVNWSQGGSVKFHLRRWWPYALDFHG
jgi:hypothetical protein